VDCDAGRSQQDESAQGEAMRAPVVAGRDLARTSRHRAA